MVTQMGVYFQLATAVRGTFSDELCDNFTGNGFRAAIYFSRHGCIQQLVSLKEQTVSYIIVTGCLDCLISQQKSLKNASPQGMYIMHTNTVHEFDAMQYSGSSIIQILSYLNCLITIIFVVIVF